MTQPMDWVIFFGANIAATEPVEGSCARLVVHDVAWRGVAYPYAAVALLRDKGSRSNQK